MVLYELINQNEADRIKEILETSWLYKEIKIEIDKFNLEVFSVSETNYTEHHEPYDMKEFYLLNEESEFQVLKYKNRGYNAFINIGEWGYKTRLEKTHITLGSSKFHDFCFQIELSQAVKDDENIYIIKNVSNMGGEGAICRLYRGLKKDKEEKLKRQELFIQRYEKEVIRYRDKNWVVISKIKISQLYEKDKKEKIFYNLLHNMFFAMLLVENISEKIQLNKKI